VLGAIPSRVGDDGFNVPLTSVVIAGAAAGHRVLGIQQEIEETCCSLRVAVNRRSSSASSSSTRICAVLNCVRAATACRDHLVQVGGAEKLVVEVREKLSRPLAISAARKLCCVILSSTG